MCRPAPSLNYSPRTLVAIAAVADGPTSGKPDGGDSGGAPGGATPTPPAPPFGSPDAAWRNLTQPMPAGQKFRLLVRNVRIRIKRGQPCCGHPGEPGC